MMHKGTSDSAAEDVSTIRITILLSLAGNLAGIQHCTNEALPQGNIGDAACIGLAEKESSFYTQCATGWYQLLRLEH
jgi:hypothetical protein